MGGGHVWSSKKTQNIPLDVFKCHNWRTAPYGTDPSYQFNCDQAQKCNDDLCFIRQLMVDEATPILNWLATFELLGIPQIRIKNENFPDIQCNVDPNDQTVPKETYLGLPPELIAENAIPEYAEGDGTAKGYYSAVDKANFDPANLQMIFDPDTITCCLPAGEMVGTTTDPSFCCTGMIDENGRCALPDFADVSLYYNRFVSSGAINTNLDASLFDADTGYITDPTVVESLACEQKICASGVIARGISLNTYTIPGKFDEQGNEDCEVQRFVEQADLNSYDEGVRSLAKYFEQGLLKYNTHVYCVPQAITSVQDEKKRLTVIECD